MTNIEFRLISNSELTENDHKTFGELLIEQNKVKGNCFTKAGRCKLICIVKEDAHPVAIGAIKPKSSSDFLASKADIENLSSEFDWEIGYLFTRPKNSGKGIASNVVKMLLEKVKNDNIMASTEISKNTAMVKILKKNGFKQYGKPWKSSIHGNYLGLFLKFS